MIVTRLAIAVGVVFFGFLCYLAIRGFTALTVVLVTVIVLFAFVGAGNLLSGRRSGGGGRGTGPGGPR